MGTFAGKSNDAVGVVGVLVAGIAARAALRFSSSFCMIISTRRLHRIPSRSRVTLTRCIPIRSLLPRSSAFLADSEALIGDPPRGAGPSRNLIKQIPRGLPVIGWTLLLTDSTSPKEEPKARSCASVVNWSNPVMTTCIAGPGPVVFASNEYGFMILGAIRSLDLGEAPPGTGLMRYWPKVYPAITRRGSGI